MSAKIILLGKRCDETHDLFMSLNEYFQVKLCTTDYSLFSDVKRLFKPDLIVLCFVNYPIPDSRYMDLIQKDVGTPIITVGMEKIDLSFEKIYSGNSFTNIKRADGKKMIIKTVCKMLGIDNPAPDSLSEDRNRGFKPMVLVVDDVAMLLRQIYVMLKDHYDVEVATSGIQAMSKIGRLHPDIILMDYAMPQYNGKEIFEVLKMNDATRDIPVVFLTGVSDNSRVEEVINLKPAGYLLKPPNKDKLIDMIETVLERYERRRRKKKEKEEEEGKSFGR